jgi:hypothetical protein
MSMGPLGGIAGSAAGVPLSQSAGSETERAQKDAHAQHRQVDTEQRAERAAGIGQTDKDQESSERDADGRRLWEAPAEPADDDQNDDATNAAGVSPRQSKDATGQSGTHLDLTG